MKNELLKHAAIYHIYPTSFYDGNGDGVGDLVGIAEKLAYIKELGFDVVWMSPIFLSPFRDGGYDVEDYRTIDPRFGSMDDFMYLMERANALGIKILLDLVIGHTSDRHRWFLESQKKTPNRYSDYYRWTDNSLTGTSPYPFINGVTERDGAYMLNFFAFQPSLNYGVNKVEQSWQIHYRDERLAPLRNEIIQIMLFWLRKGVSGFRVDLAGSLVKNDYDGEGLKWLWNLLIGTVKREFPRAIFIAEWGNPSFSVGQCGFDSDFLLHENPEYNDLFRNEPGDNIFRFLERGKNYFSSEGAGDVSAFLSLTQRIAEQVKDSGYFAFASGNHDLIRISHNKTQAELKVAYAMIFTFNSVPILYYGDEIGMKYHKVDNIDGGYIRTGARICMQWSQGKNAGFSECDNTYYPAFADEECNVESQLADQNSLLHTVRSLNALRKERPCLSNDGVLEIISAENGGYPLIYRRKNEEDSIVVALNPGGKDIDIELNFRSVLMSVNAACCNGKVRLGANSFVIAQE